MNIRAHSVVWTLLLAPVLGCGDDGSGGDPLTDSGIDESTTTDSGGPADGGQVVDAAPVLDAAGQPPSDAASDSGKVELDAARDSGRDAGPGVVDSGPARDSGRDAAMQQDTGVSQDTGVGQAAPGKSEACLECERKRCIAPSYLLPNGASQDFFNLTMGCGMLEGEAAGGPSMGTPRKQLCEEYLDCARETGCASPTLESCICGEMGLSACTDYANMQGTLELPGACKFEAIAAAEGTEVKAIFDDALGLALAGGNNALAVASFLLSCSESKCTNECFAPCASQADGTVCDREWDAVTMEVKTSRVCVSGRCQEDCDSAGYPKLWTILDPELSDGPYAGAIPTQRPNWCAGDAGGMPGEDAGSAAADAGASGMQLDAGM